MHKPIPGYLDPDTESLLSRWDFGAEKFEDDKYWIAPTDFSTFQ